MVVKLVVAKRKGRRQLVEKMNIGYVKVFNQ